MVTDHTQANQDLLQIAKQQDLTVATGLDPADQCTEKRLWPNFHS